MKSVAIVGGGVSGLICIKCCLDAGLSPTCYEMTSDIGGLWNYDSNAIDGKASVMKSTVINTSKEFMAFSDFPPPQEYPNYMHNTKLLTYFRLYAEIFRLRDYIRFRRRINRIEPAEDYDQTGSWMVYSADVEGKLDEVVEKYDAVMLATGHHAHPRWADFPGLQDFKGRVLHSWQYKTSQGFEDKNVLVVGVGNSGGDLVVELSRIAKQVYLSTRRGTWVLNRVGPNGLPADMVFVGELSAAVQRYCPKLVNWLLERDINSRFNHETYGLKPKHRVLEQHPFLNDDLANRILCGSAIVKPNIKQFTSDGYSVIFEDGSRVDHIDYVLMATGFNIAFPYLNQEILPVDENRVRLYEYVWPPHLKHPTLAVMGLVQPWGAINPLTELQARWAARVFNGELKLPSRTTMDADIDQKITEMSNRYAASPRHTLEVDYVDYCNELADHIGCRPNILHYLRHDFQLGRHLLFGSFTPYRFRLQGPNRWTGARQAILTQSERVEYPLHQGRRKRTNQSILFSSFFTSILIIFVVLVLLYFVFS